MTSDVRRGRGDRFILKTILDKDNRISDHIYDQNNPKNYAQRQVEQAKAKIEFVRSGKDGDDEAERKLLPIQTNFNIALIKLGVSLDYDQFAERIKITGLKEFGPLLDDPALIHLQLTLKRRWPPLSWEKGTVADFACDNAQLNRFHPVCDYLDDRQPRWDKVQRIDRWLTIYGGAEDNEYTRAVGALVLIAAVRRVRQPGCKFDEMLVLEGNQGTERSSALRILAVHDEWFSDDLPLNLDSREVIERLSGHWIVEVGELSGMKKTDVEHE